MRLKKLGQNWNDFWFKPRSVLNISLFRILFGLLLLWYLLGFVRADESTWFGPGRIVSLSTNFSVMQYPRLDLLLLLPDTDAAVSWFCTVLSIAALSFCLGFMYRLSALIVFLGILSLHHHAPFYCNASDSYIRLVSFFMIFAPANKMLSLDSWLSKNQEPNESLESSWVQRILQIQLCACYFECFWSKSVSEQWWDGSAIYYVTHLQQLSRFSITWLTQYSAVCSFLSWMVLFIEFSLACLTWIREFRYPILVLGLIMHMGMELTLFLPLFQYLFPCTYVLFVNPGDIQKVLSKLQKWFALRMSKPLTNDSTC